MGKPNPTAEQLALALRLHAKGLDFREVGEQIDSPWEIKFCFLSNRFTEVLASIDDIDLLST